VRTTLDVFEAPAFQDNARFAQIAEEFAVKAFIAQPIESWTVRQMRQIEKFGKTCKFTEPARIRQYLMSVQTFSGRTLSGPIRVDQPHAIRSVTFVKESAASRLRITYRDTASINVHPIGYTARVQVHIDGVPVDVLETAFIANNSPSDGFPFYSVATPFVTIGYAEGIAAGTHTLSSVYVVTGTLISGPPTFGFIPDTPFFIEIEELA
jgi:hypothetical protein